MAIPVAISTQNSRCFSRRCEGAPGDFIGELCQKLLSGKTELQLLRDRELATLGSMMRHLALSRYRQNTRRQIREQLGEEQSAEIAREVDNAVGRVAQVTHAFTMPLDHIDRSIAENLVRRLRGEEARTQHEQAVALGLSQGGRNGVSARERSLKQRLRESLAGDLNQSIER